jgi:hypothetical protein
MGRRQLGSILVLVETTAFDCRSNASLGGTGPLQSLSVPPEGD